MRKTQFGGVEHLAGNFGEGGAAGVEILAVAQDRVAKVMQMDADLVRPAGFDGDRDMGATRRAGLHG